MIGVAEFSDDDGAPGEEQSALKARDLGVAFAHPNSPVRDQPSGMTLMSNSPDAFKGREIRVSHAAGVRFDDRTTNREEFPAHPVSPANYGNGVRKAYAPSPVKFEGKTTMREEYPAHPVSPRSMSGPQPTAQRALCGARPSWSASGRQTCHIRQGVMSTCHIRQ